MPTGASQYTLADDHPHRPGTAAPLETSRRVDKPRFDTLWGYAVGVRCGGVQRIARPGMQATAWHHIGTRNRTALSDGGFTGECACYLTSVNVRVTSNASPTARTRYAPLAKPCPSTASCCA